MPHSALVIGLWCAVVATGVGAMLRYEFTSVPTVPAAGVWPAESRLVRSEHRPTVLMFVHPRCPCSRSSLGELERVSAEASTATRLYVVFIRPPGVPSGWERTELWNSAAAISNASRVVDFDGEEARRFRVRGSGHTLVYDANGTLLFSGGLTASRGHAGPSAGSAAVLSLLRGFESTAASTPVFGCSLGQSSPRPVLPRMNSSHEFRL